jgi:hypothetical protein
MSADPRASRGHVDLYWIPLGAGTALPLVRWSGRVYETLAARRARREAHDLYHAALEVWLDARRFTLEMAPAWGRSHGGPGVVDTGPVGIRALGSSRFFRYEVRRWPDGVIPDLACAVSGPQRVCDDAARTQAVYNAVADAPLLTWGRDDLGAGDMWNSNSLVSWCLARGGVDLDTVTLPDRGRAPGWTAGAYAARQPR